jgi:hypothetical protein
MDFWGFQGVGQMHLWQGFSLGQNGLIIVRNLKPNIIKFKLQKFPPFNIGIPRWI